MKLSQAFWQTLREDPSDAEIPSHKLLMRAGLIHKTAAGIYSYLPFATRTLQKIKTIIREEMNKTGAQEIIMSFVTPAELWQESGRWNVMGPEMLRVKDRKNNDFCLSPTNEESVTDIFKKSVTSYKQLPVNLYQITSKFRDEVRPRFGLMRGKEFTMKDAYTFHLDKKCMDELYEKYYKAYSNIIERMGLKYIVVEADGGTIAGAGSRTHEFQVIADSGEDLVVCVPALNYAANSEKAVTYRANLNFTTDNKIKEIETKNLSTCADVCNMLKVPVYQSLKTLVFTYIKDNVEKNIMILLLGDDELNEVKLKNYLAAQTIHPSVDNVLEKLGLPKGYMSPYQKEASIEVILDAHVDPSKSYIVGANKVDYHISGYVPKEHLKNFKHIDLRLSQKTDVGEDRKSPVEFRRGIEVGHIFQLGDKYTKAMGATVLDQNGKTFNPLMGCYGIGVTRIMAAAIEQKHDENGIIWPISIAPYQVYYVSITKAEASEKIANEIYHEMLQAGIEVIYDDRKSGPGPKFKDADLLGLPIRVTFGERDFNESGELEVRERATGKVSKVKKAELLSFINNTIESLKKKNG